MHSEFRFRNFQILDISDVIKIYKTQKNENTNFQFYRFLKCCRLTKPKRERDQKDWICDRNNGFASKKNLNRLSLKKIWRYCFTKNSRSEERILNYIEEKMAALDIEDEEETVELVPLEEEPFIENEPILIDDERPMKKIKQEKITSFFLKK